MPIGYIISYDVYMHKQKCFSVGMAKLTTQAPQSKILATSLVELPVKRLSE